VAAGLAAAVWRRGVVFGGAWRPPHPAPASGEAAGSACPGPLPGRHRPGQAASPDHGDRDMAARRPVSQWRAQRPSKAGGHRVHLLGPRWATGICCYPAVL